MSRTLRLTLAGNGGPLLVDATQTFRVEPRDGGATLVIGTARLFVLETPAEVLRRFHSAEAA